VPVRGYQTPVADPDDSAYAELEHALADLKKAAELDPKDRSILYYMAQVYIAQSAILLKKLERLAQAGKGQTDEAKRLAAEIERIGDELQRLLEDLPQWQQPGPRPGSPCDTPIPVLEPSRDGPARV
jgi:hypothetical protein